MFTFIKNLFTEETASKDTVSKETVSEYQVMSERKLMKTTSLTYQYLELYINALSRNYNYDVLEQLSSGQIITHLTDVSHTQMKDYVRRVYIESVPPKFIIQATQN